MTNFGRMGLRLEFGEGFTSFVEYTSQGLYFLENLAF